MSQSHAAQYETAPHKTFLTLSIPVLFSLVAEPLTGLADTAFVARLGAEPLAALGLGTMVLSSAFWVFSFLGIGTQTELAQALGRSDTKSASLVVGTAVKLAFLLGTITAICTFFLLNPIATAMGGEGAVLTHGVTYMKYRLIGAPAMLITIACFGALRGVQNMRAPLYIAAGMNGLNVLLDWLLIFGIGPFPAMGVQGAALATSLSQWLGCLWALHMVKQSIGISLNGSARDMLKLVQIGGDIFIRTGMAIGFLLLSTRIATAAGAEIGAAHQAIRQFFIFTALFLDAFAITAQSLIGYYIGADNRPMALDVAKTTCIWSIVTGCLLTVAMLAGERQIIWLLVPQEAAACFAPAWMVAAIQQPINSLSFAADGIHWGTGDFAYLRNAMVLSASAGMAGLFFSSYFPHSEILIWIWICTAIWTTGRSGLGMLRIWPGIGKAPLRQS